MGSCPMKLAWKVWKWLAGGQYEGGILFPFIEIIKDMTKYESQLTRMTFNVMQRDTVGLTSENKELKLRLEALEQHAHLRDGNFFNLYQIIPLIYIISKFIMICISWDSHSSDQNRDIMTLRPKLATNCKITLDLVQRPYQISTLKKIILPQTSKLTILLHIIIIAILFPTLENTPTAIQFWLNNSMYHLSWIWYLLGRHSNSRKRVIFLLCSLYYCVQLLIFSLLSQLINLLYVLQTP